MDTADFNYHLPEALIAQEPPAERGESRMMVLHRATGVIEHRQVPQLGDYLDPGDCLVLNNTRVIPARIFGHREDTGGQVELLLVERKPEARGQRSEVRDQRSEVRDQRSEARGQRSEVRDQRSEARGQRSEVRDQRSEVRDQRSEVRDQRSEVWDCLIKAGFRAREGMRLVMGEGTIKAEILDVGQGGHVTVRLESDGPLMDVLDHHGAPPLPPYIKRSRPRPVDGGRSDQRSIDRERYQTVYADQAGAVAAPTAGLHFTTGQLAHLAAQGVKQAKLTLHVGPGTFKPVKTECVEDHVMESERYVVSNEAADTINDARKKGGRIVAVGSTSVRTLETVSRDDGTIVGGAGRSALFIYPPYTFKAVDAMLTNFHLPQSTLLMMVCALAGHDHVMQAYQAAIDKKYRFYSYGDCMLVL